MLKEEVKERLLQAEIKKHQNINKIFMKSNSEVYINSAIVFDVFAILFVIFARIAEQHTQVVAVQKLLWFIFGALFIKTYRLFVAK
jgi:hypothetical protein